MIVEEAIDEKNIVFSLMQEHKWDRALKEAKKSPKLVSGLYHVGGFYDGQIHSRVNALHLASIMGAPSTIIQRLAAIHPESAVQVDSKYGRVPLQVAVMMGAEPGTVNALLRANPKAVEKRDNNKRIALHYSCKDNSTNGEASTRILLRGFPVGALVADDSGFLPLHVACRYGRSLTVIRMLIRASPESMLAKTNKGSTPIMCARTNKQGIGTEAAGILERCAEETLNRSLDGNGMQTSGSNDSFDAMANTNIRRVRANYS